MDSYHQEYLKKRDYFERIKVKAMAAGTSPRQAWRRICDGWGEDEAINNELRIKRLRAETRDRLRKSEDVRLLAVAPSFLPGKTKPLVIPDGPMPETAWHETMVKALEASRKMSGKQSDGENQYTKQIRELTEGKS